MSGWCKNIMSTEQKKSDFRPEEHGVGLVERTTVWWSYEEHKQLRWQRQLEHYPTKGFNKHSNGSVFVFYISVHFSAVKLLNSRFCRERGHALVNFLCLSELRTDSPPGKFCRIRQIARFRARLHGKRVSPGGRGTLCTRVEDTVVHLQSSNMVGAPSLAGSRDSVIFKKNFFKAKLVSSTART